MARNDGAPAQIAAIGLEGHGYIGSWGHDRFGLGKPADPGVARIDELHPPGEAPAARRFEQRHGRLEVGVVLRAARVLRLVQKRDLGTAVGNAVRSAQIASAKGSRIRSSRRQTQVSSSDGSRKRSIRQRPFSRSRTHVWCVSGSAGRASSSRVRRPSAGVPTTKTSRPWSAATNLSSRWAGTATSRSSCSRSPPP